MLFKTQFPNQPWSVLPLYLLNNSHHIDSPERSLIQFMVSLIGTYCNNGKSTAVKSLQIRHLNWLCAVELLIWTLNYWNELSNCNTVVRVEVKSCIQYHFEGGSNTWPLHPDYYSFSAPDVMGNEVHTATINPYEYEINMTSVAKGTANWITAYLTQQPTVKRRLQGLFDGWALQSDFCTREVPTSHS